ncbi:MAG: PD-(D/E)XK nuclease family protein, partial [Alphaproteobacteria bacterium]|nr:PD-(D/E)XK nuclease family protein [Alphaproteobacteria bacterium]
GGGEPGAAGGRPAPGGRPAGGRPAGAGPGERPAARWGPGTGAPCGADARHILGLRALDPIAADPGAADYGNAVHHALEQFAAKYPVQIPGSGEAEAVLLEMGRQAFGELLTRPGVRAFWWPRFQRIAAWFLVQEAARRPAILPLVTEARGSLSLPGPAGPFTLTAIADRIDRMADGSVNIIDYKTGVIPSETELKQGEAPQLPLEAAIAASGGFPGVPGGVASTLSYWRVSGGREAGEIKDIKTDGDVLAQAAQAGLQALIAQFDDPATAYLARPRPAIAPRFSDYDHLARIKEWSAGGPGDF